MIDWYMLIVPAAVFVLLWLLGFVGCYDPVTLTMIAQPYADDVTQDHPLVWYRMQELPGTSTASDETGHLNGQYGIAFAPLTDPSCFSQLIAAPSQQLGAGSVMPKDPQELSVRFDGSFISTQGKGPIGDLPRFTLEALVHPEWDVANDRNFYCVLDYSHFVPGLGAPGRTEMPASPSMRAPTILPTPTRPSAGNSGLAQATNLRAPILSPGGPGPLVSAEDTYLAVVFDDTRAFLWAHTANADLDSVVVEVIRRPYVQVTDPDPTKPGLSIGISGNFSCLIGTFPGPPGFIYPFVGRMAEAAIYNTVLNQGRIMSHIMNAFNT